MAFRWCADDGPTWMLAYKLCDFQGIWTSSAKNLEALYFCDFFRGSPDALSPLSGSAHEGQTTGAA